jgi:hypothetical protein
MMERLLRENEWSDAQYKNYRNHEDRGDACIRRECHYERSHKIAKITQSFTTARLDSVREGLIRKKCEQAEAITYVQINIYLTEICRIEQLSTALSWIP